MEPYTQDPSVRMIEIVISIAYPLGTLLLLAVARPPHDQPRRAPAGLLPARGQPASALMLSDAAYTFTLLNETYYTGSLVDAGWLVSYVLWGAAALHPSMSDALASRRSRSPCASPAAAWRSWRWPR